MVYGSLIEPIVGHQAAAMTYPVSFYAAVELYRTFANLAGYFHLVYCNGIQLMAIGLPEWAVMLTY